MSDSHRHPTGSMQDVKEEKHDHGGIFGKNTEFYFSMICGILLLAGFGIQQLFAGWFSIPVYILSYLFGSVYTVREAAFSLRHGKFEIDFLMLVAAAGAAALGEWPEGALLLFLFSLGHSLENRAMDKARKSIEALADLTPHVALVRRNGETIEVAVEDLQRGEIVIVKPNSKIPADGIVVSGSSSVNQAPITGESIPVDKSAITSFQWTDNDEKKIPPEHRVYAGTINGTGALEIKTIREAKDSTLARVIRMVKEAEQQQSPTQHFTRNIERYYVPAILIIVTLLVFAFMVIDEPFSKSFYRAMSVLVAASPCALAISTPAAVLSGVARAARQGVLVKGGRPLEDLGMLTAVAFDKTGTLTEGKPKLNKVITVDGISEEELLRTVVAVERLSDHPLAAAVVKGGMERLGNVKVEEAIGLQAHLGKGIQAQYKGQTVIVGNDELFRSFEEAGFPNDIAGLVASLQQEGNTTMVVKRGSTYLGIIGVMDVPRPEAAGVLQELKKLGIKKMVMLTGDNQRVADAIARQIGLTDAQGDLLPEEKVAAIDNMRKRENRIAMVGDGVNDAPAMAKSTVGIAMGAAGSDVALETADIALMADRLDNLPFAIGLSRKSRMIIKQNLFISLGMVAVLIPLTIAGWASLGPAVVGHEGSTVVVVLNALRLLSYKSKMRL